MRVPSDLLARNTPTGVGKTHLGLERSGADEKHPHRRGEDFGLRLYGSGKSETPPQAWGRLISEQVPYGRDGNTPTGVGKTRWRTTTKARKQKHPHRRGEDTYATLILCLVMETPPQAWGRPTWPRTVLGQYRNTPTGVGKTEKKCLIAGSIRKHPHRRGEDRRASRRRGWLQETPPQAWGRPRQNPCALGRKGNTPTGVGKTKPRHVALSQDQKHPHRRGEDSKKL